MDPGYRTKMLHRCVAPFTLSNFVVKVIEGDKVVSTYPLPEFKPGGSSEIKVGRLSSKATLVIENKQGIRVYDSALR